MQENERGGESPAIDWKRVYEAEYARVFGKKIKVVNGRTGIFKLKPADGPASRAGYRRSDILRMTEELKARASSADLQS